MSVITADPGTRLLVTYQRAGNRCTLPCRYVSEKDGDLLVEVERVQATRMTETRTTSTRWIHAEEIREVRHV